jgi:hypothetical protein
MMEEVAKMDRNDAEKLQAYLKTVPVGNYLDVRKKIIDECMIKNHTFNNWRYGFCRIPQLHKKKIEEVIGEKIFL